MNTSKICSESLRDIIRTGDMSHTPPSMKKVMKRNQYQIVVKSTQKTQKEKPN